jgi:hypothetical protein
MRAIHAVTAPKGTTMSNGIRHGHPEVTRNDKWEHDKYVWPGGLELSTTTPRAGLSGPMDGSKRGLPNACHDDRSSTRDLKKETPGEVPHPLLN